MSADRLQERHGTASEWASVNPVLLEGEPGAETDTGQEKLGDGVQHWNDLPYVGGSGSAGTGDIDGGEADSVYGGTENIDGGNA